MRLLKGMIPATRQKWRPTLGMIVVTVLLSVLMLPLVGLMFLRFYENQLVRETEGELIAQGAVLAAAMSDAVARNPGTDLRLGATVAPGQSNAPDAGWSPILPVLDLTRDPVLGPRPDTVAPGQPTHPAYVVIGAALDPLVVATSNVTLAGIRVLDPFGTVIAGRNETGRSLAHVPEVRDALAGKYSSVLRERLSDEPSPPLYSISRGTGIRVFVAMPVMVGDRVAGVVYLSRTPNNVLRQLYDQRVQVAIATVLVLAITLAVALLVARTITGPIRQLTRRTAEIGRGDRGAIRPLTRHGSREVAELSQAFLRMADQLFERSDYIANFAAHVSHELKSPLTAMRGAAELLRDAEASMTEPERRKFLDNIVADSERLSMLVERLRDLARADSAQIGGQCVLAEAVADAASHLPQLRIGLDPEPERSPDVAMAKDNLAIVFKHLLENAAENGATSVRIVSMEVDGTIVTEIGDDGRGVGPENAERIFDAFFTTRREAGGTGMGLNIVQSMLRAHGGSIRWRPADGGACFEIVVPRPA